MAEYLLRISIDEEAMDEGATLDEAIEAIASEMIANDSLDGPIRPGLADPVGKFSVFEVPDRLLVDRATQIAAANLMMAFDLPAPMGDVAQHMQLAALIAPGITTGDLPNMNNSGRRTALLRARALIDDMLATGGETPSNHDTSRSS